MKRSTLNQYIAEAATFFEDNHFVLPPFATWTPEQWRRSGSDAKEMRVQRLGWDITDFDSGDFEKIGLTMFTLRNGLSSAPRESKPYAEKIMLVRNGQVTPYHFHFHKVEDIINRGSSATGKLVVQVYGSTQARRFSDTPVTVICDGTAREVEPGGEIILGPGESITLRPYVFHMFYAINGDALIGEVSSTNDDATDNFFDKPVGRFPNIDEDEAPLRLLCTEY